MLINGILKRLNTELIRGNSRLLRERPTWFNRGNIYNLSIQKVGICESTNDVEVKFDYHSNNGYIYECFFTNFKNNYPFHPPETIINNKRYDGVIKCSRTILDLWVKRLNICCLCCTSLLCRNNWNPVHGLIDIIEEYIERKDLIYNYQNYQIVMKYCPLTNSLPFELKDIILDFLIKK